MKTEFIFDKETKTITGYKGNEINLTIPSKIDGIEVKKIAKGAFDKTNKSLEKIRKLTISEEMCIRDRLKMAMTEDILLQN